MSLGNTGGDPIQLKPDQLKVLSLGFKYNRLGTWGVTRFNSRCCLPRFVIQLVREDNQVTPIISLGNDSNTTGLKDNSVTYMSYIPRIVRYLSQIINILGNNSDNSVKRRPCNSSRCFQLTLSSRPQVFLIQSGTLSSWSRARTSFFNCSTSGANLHLGHSNLRRGINIYELSSFAITQPT